MIRSRTIFLSGAAIGAVCLSLTGVRPGPAYAASPEGAQIYGALYPGDVVEPVTPAPQKSAAPSGLRQAVDPRLEKALGPAGYLLSEYNPAPAFTSSIRRAVGRHPAFHAQASNLEESQAQRRRARAALYPQLSAQFNGDYSLKRDFGASTDNVVESLRPREQFTAGLSASQLIFDGGATLARIRSARALDDEYKNALSTRINDLALSALTAYQDVAAHQALTAFSAAFLRRHEQILKSVKERERLGAGSKADVTRAFARLAASRARLVQIQESARFADIIYEEFFGAAPDRLTRPVLNAPGMESRNEVIATALENNPDIAVAQARADARQADFKAAKGARLPEVRLSVDTVKYDIFDNGDDFDMRAGLNVNYNIFGGGARAADIALARSRARKEKYNEEQVRQDVARESAMAYERVNSAGLRLAALADALVANDETRELVLERYKLSRGDLIDVLQAENDYFEAGVAYLNGLSGRDIAVYALMEHTGDLLRHFSPQNEYTQAVAGNSGMGPDFGAAHD